MMVALMAEFGMSTIAISERTKLTPGQVSYRTGKFGIKRAFYRNGESIGARAVMRHGHEWIQADVERQLRQKLGLQR